MPAALQQHHLRFPHPTASMHGGMLRRAFALLVAAHALAHFVGTSDSFSRAADGRAVDWLAGGWQLSDPAVLRLFAFAWAFLAVAYAAVALAIWLDAPRWPAALALVSLVSLAFVAVALWDSVVGAVRRPRPARRRRRRVAPPGGAPPAGGTPCRRFVKPPRSS